MSKLILRNGPYDGYETEVNSINLKYIIVDKPVVISGTDTTQQVIEKIVCVPFCAYKFLNVIDGDYYYEWVINFESLSEEELKKSIYD